MRFDRRRTKKLIVAFHFQRANQAAWKCDACRKSGLETKRNCGWIEPRDEQPSRPVWGDRDVAIEQCPVSYVSAASLGWIESFSAWKLLGGEGLHSLPARTAEAFCWLERELRKEVQDG